MPQSKKNTLKPFIIDDESIISPYVKDKVFNPIVDGEVKGHGYVPRDYATYPQEMFDPPRDLKIIPRSELSDRIKEQERMKSRLSDIRGDIPSLDQNGRGYCASADTEVLTSSGFVRWDEYNWSDLLGTVNPHTHSLEFQHPLQKHVYQYSGEMVCSTNRRIDFSMTPDHRMWVRKWDQGIRTLSNQYSFQRAADLGWYVGLMPAPSGFVGTELVELAVEGDRSYDGDDFLALVSAIVSCGYVGGSDNTKGWVSFCCFREDERAKYEALAQRTGFKEKPSERGVWVRYNAHALSKWIQQNCYTDSGNLKAQDKKIPDIVKCSSSRQIKHFLSFFGDQDHNPSAGRKYYSASKRVADDLQELCLRIGKRASVDFRQGRDSVRCDGVIIHSKGLWEVYEAKEDRLCLDRKKHIESDRYKGLVYCATVPNGTLVTRKNGTVLISGNCWSHSTTSCVMLLRALNNQPYVRLSAYAIACMIKNFRDEGGWCGLSAKFWREKGCPSSQFWPERSVSRNNDNPATWANAALHKISEEWTDLTQQVYDQNLTFDQVATCLLLGIPCALDFNWWSHSVCGMDLVEVEPGSFGIRIWNSWGDNWEDRGMGILRGNKAIPNGAVALRVTGASAA